MPPEVQPITSPQAAERLDRAQGTIRYWVTHFAARRVGKVGKVMYYDFNDLAVIEREIRHGHPVPPTPELRAEIRSRCPIAVAERETRAA
jgi:hypothetical protein